VLSFGGASPPLCAIIVTLKRSTLISAITECQDTQPRFIAGGWPRKSFRVSFDYDWLRRTRALLSVCLSPNLWPWFSEFLCYLLQLLFMLSDFSCEWPIRLLTEVCWTEDWMMAGGHCGDGILLYKCDVSHWVRKKWEMKCCLLSFSSGPEQVYVLSSSRVGHMSRSPVLSLRLIAFLPRYFTLEELWTLLIFVGIAD